MKKHFHWLDLLRFLAAFEVVVSHYRGVFFSEYGLLPPEQQNFLNSIFYSVTRLSSESVLIFFVLSGYLVGGKSLKRILSNTVDVKSYFIDRFARIMLPLIASVVLVIIIDLITEEQIPWLHIAGSLFSLQGIFTNDYTNSPIWSLSYEVWFYVLMGCIMAISRIRRWTTLLFSFLLLIFVCFVFTKLNPVYLLVWFIGAFAFLLPKSNGSISKLKLFLYFGLFLFALVLLQLTSGSHSISFGNLSMVDKNIVIVFAALTTSLFIHSLTQFIPVNTFSIKMDYAGSKLSKFSYSLYLTHYPLMYLFCYYGLKEGDSLNMKSVSLYVCAVGFALLIGYLIYLASEKHTSVVKKLLKDITSKT